jgi:excinuclease ABC subunit B
MTLVDHGFRLPSALDNRPLKFEEWEAKNNQICFVSATPTEFELSKTGGEVVEQIIRPTGLLDPIVEVVPARGQVNHLLEQIRERAASGDRVLVTALTKRLAEDLATFMQERNVRCRWLHSELNAFERVDLLQELRAGRFDCLIGVNLLREGLDLPEVSLVAILDADKEGFLRSETSLIQTIGRAARNVNARVILYADSVTNSMRAAMDETRRRREIQQAYNEKHGITPQSIKKTMRAGIESDAAKHKRTEAAATSDSRGQYITLEYVEALEQEMLAAAENLDFERAATIRDRVLQLKEHIGKPMSDIELEKSPAGSGASGRGRRGKGKPTGTKRAKIPRPKQ